MGMKAIVGIGVVVLVILVFFLPQAGKKNPTIENELDSTMAQSQQREEQNMNKKQYATQPEQSIVKGKSYMAKLTTDKGDMNVLLFSEETPVTVNNFVFLARQKFYDETVFHRVIKGFMIQGGDPEGTGRGGPGYRFADEPITREYKRGTIAMANAGPNTNGSQFFIMHEDYALPKNYVIFGQIDSTDKVSFATLDTIAQVPVTDNGMGEESKPASLITLKSVTIEEK